MKKFFTDKLDKWIHLPKLHIKQWYVIRWVSFGLLNVYLYYIGLSLINFIVVNVFLFILVVSIKVHSVAMGIIYQDTLHRQHKDMTDYLKYTTPKNRKEIN